VGGMETQVILALSIIGWTAVACLAFPIVNTLYEHLDSLNTSKSRIQKELLIIMYIFLGGPAIWILSFFMGIFCLVDFWNDRLDSYLYAKRLKNEKK
jgi:hypothetical protein